MSGKESKSVDDLRKEHAQDEIFVHNPKKKVEKSISDNFIEELDEKEKGMFLKMREVRMGSCQLEEFEAVTEDSLDDYAMLITYMKNGKIRFENDGVCVKIRNPIMDDSGNEITKELKILHERNAAREKVFTKKFRFKRNDINSSSEYSNLCLAASFANVDYNGRNVIISPGKLDKVHKNDKALLMTCFDFFRR